MNSTIEAIQLRRGGIPGDVEGLAGEHLLRIHRSQLNLRGQDLGSPEPHRTTPGCGIACRLILRSSGHCRGWEHDLLDPGPFFVPFEECGLFLPLDLLGLLNGEAENRGPSHVDPTEDEVVNDAGLQPLGVKEAGEISPEESSKASGCVPPCLLLPGTLNFCHQRVSGGGAFHGEKFAFLEPLLQLLNLEVIYV